MACVNADGTLTPIAKKVLTALITPGTGAEISERSGVALYRVRSSFRELTALGVVEEIDGYYQISEYGRGLIAK